MGVGGQYHALAALPPGKDSVPIVQEAGWAPGPVWTGAENLASTGIRSLDRPACSESLYRLSHPGRLKRMYLLANTNHFYPLAERNNCPQYPLGCNSLFFILCSAEGDGKRFRKRLGMNKWPINSV